MDRRRSNHSARRDDWKRRGCRRGQRGNERRSRQYRRSGQSCKNNKKIIGLRR